MMILAIDSSGLPASAAVYKDGKIAALFTVNNALTHSQTLLPMIDEMQKISGISYEELSAVAVAKGPGSFTGLRIGSATAKGIALAKDIPIIEISTLDALAFCLYGTDRVICPMMDARRGQVYTGLYCFEDGELSALAPPSACAVEDIINAVNETGRPVIFTGDGYPVYEEKIKTLTRVPFMEAAPFQNRQNAAALAVLAAKSLNEGRTVDADLHVPDYMRLSQAEREKAEKEKALKEKAKGEQAC